MKIPFIDLQTQYQAYKNEIDEAIKRVLDSSGYIMGPEVDGLQKELAEYVGVKHAIGCSSGTSAIELALRALGIGAGDEVITTPFTFFATAEMINAVGAEPVFVDIDRETYNIDPQKIEDAITQKTKAIMPVGIFGQCANMAAVESIAKKYNLRVIEDAAQSFGAVQGGKKSCSFGDVACTSFFPAKPLGCYGDGGAVFTNSDELAERIKILLNHGQTVRYVHSHIGMNGRLDAIQAAILRVKLKHFDAEIAKRQEVAKFYNEALKGVTTTPYIAADNVSAYAQYTILVDDREGFIAKMAAQRIPTAIHYPIPLYKQEVYKYMNVDSSLFPVCEEISARVISLPFSPFITKEDLTYVCDTIKGIL